MSKSKQTTLFQSWGNKGEGARPRVSSQKPSTSSGISGSASTSGAKRTITGDPVDTVELLDSEDEEDMLLAMAMEQSLKEIQPGQDLADPKPTCINPLPACGNITNIAISSANDDHASHTDVARTDINNTSIEEIPGFDMSAGRLWIYPTNYPVRTYQYDIVQQCLYKNTLVALPTGLGKTFIAAVVMYNFYRWYPEGKIVFMAPTKPLVAQQIEACYNIMGIPQTDTAVMTGAMLPPERLRAWSQKRVFYLTPQVMTNDLSRGAFPAEDIKCLVVDEAHKALGNHAYCQVVRELVKYSRDFRVLALSATPGSDLKAVQQVLTNLLVSHIELRTEDSADIKAYAHDRKVEKIVVKLGAELDAVKTKYMQILSVVVGKLVKLRVLYNREPTSLSKFLILKAREQFRQDPPQHLQRHQYGIVEGDFAMCMSLYHGFELLQQHGLRSLHQFLKSIVSGEKGHGRTRSELMRNQDFNAIMEMLEEKFEPKANHVTQSGPSQSGLDPAFVSGHPKLEKLQEVVLEHFKKFQNDSTATRIMIFSQYRDSVKEINDMLERHRPLVRVMSFIGQSSAGKATKGFSQKEQLRVMKQFRDGGYNTLVSTCVGEEGLDIGDVDLIICFDAHKSPIRLIQRMGRTGRKREGRIVMLVTEGKEENIYNQSQYSKRSIHKAIMNGAKTLKFYPHSPRMVPRGVKPQCHKMHITVSKTFNKSSKGRRESSGGGQKKVTGMLGGLVKKTSKDGGLTDEELSYWSAHYKLPDSETPVIPTSGFLTLPGCRAQTEKGLSEKRSLSLSEWIPWQNRKQHSHLTGHSSSTEDFVELMQFCELQATLGDEDVYGLEMETYLNEDDILKEPNDQNTGILKFCASVTAQKTGNKKVQGDQMKSKRRSENLPVFSSQTESDSESDLPGFSAKQINVLVDVNMEDEMVDQNDKNLPKQSSSGAKEADNISKRDEKCKERGNKKSTVSAQKGSLVKEVPHCSKRTGSIEGEAPAKRKKKKRKSVETVSVITAINGGDREDFIEDVHQTNIQVNVDCKKGDIHKNHDVEIEPEMHSVQSENEINIDHDTNKEESGVNTEEENDTADLFPFYFSQKCFTNPKTVLHKDSNLKSESKVKPAPSLAEMREMFSHMDHKEQLSPVDVLELIDQWEREKVEVTESDLPGVMEEREDDWSNAWDKKVDCKSPLLVGKTASAESSKQPIRPSESQEHRGLQMSSVSDKNTKISEPEFDLRIPSDWSHELPSENDNGFNPTKISNSELKNEISEPLSNISEVKTKILDSEAKSKFSDFKSVLDVNRDCWEGLPQEETADFDLSVCDLFTDETDVNVTDQKCDNNLGKIEHRKNSICKPSLLKKKSSSHFQQKFVNDLEFNKEGDNSNSMDFSNNLLCLTTNVNHAKASSEQSASGSLESALKPQSCSTATVDRKDKKQEDATNSLIDNKLLSPDISVKAPHFSCDGQASRTSTPIVINKFVTRVKQNSSCAPGTPLKEDQQANLYHASFNDDEDDLLAAVCTPTHHSKSHNATTSQFTFTQALKAVDDSFEVGGHQSIGNHGEEGNKTRLVNDLHCVVQKDEKWALKDVEPKVNFTDKENVDDLEPSEPQFDLGFDMLDDSDLDDDDVIPPSPEHLVQTLQSSMATRLGKGFPTGLSSQHFGTAVKNLAEKTVETKNIDEHFKRGDHEIVSQELLPSSQKYSSTIMKRDSKVDFSQEPCKRSKFSLKRKSRSLEKADPSCLVAPSSSPAADIVFGPPVAVVSPQSHLVKSSSDSEEEIIVRTKRKKVLMIQSQEVKSDTEWSPSPPKRKHFPSRSKICDAVTDEESPVVKRSGSKPNKLAFLSSSTDVDDDDDFQDTKEKFKKPENIPVKSGKKKHKKKIQSAAKGFLDEEAVLSDEEAEHVSSDEDVEEEDCYDRSFINDASQCTQAPCNDSVDMHAVYLKSVRSPTLGRYKLKYDHSPDINVYSQMPAKEEEESQYMEDSFCVGSDFEDTALTEEDSFLLNDDATEKERTTKRGTKTSKDNVGRVTVPKRRRVMQLDISSSDEEEVNAPKEDQIEAMTSYRTHAENANKSPFKPHIPIVTRVHTFSENEKMKAHDVFKTPSLLERCQQRRQTYHVGKETVSSLTSRQSKALTDSILGTASTGSTSTADTFTANCQSAVDKARQERLRKQKEKQQEFQRKLAEKRKQQAAMSSFDDSETSGTRPPDKSDPGVSLSYPKESDTINSISSPPPQERSPFQLVTSPGCKKRPPGKLIIIVDSKEISGAQDLVSDLRLKHNVHAVVRQLQGCDYVVSNRMGVERRTWSDFGNGAHRAKLVERVKRLTTLYDRPVVILEKDRVKTGEEKMSKSFIHSKYFDSMLAYLAQTHIKVLFSESQAESAELLALLSQQEGKKEMSITAPTDLSRQQEQLLKLYLSLPAVNYVEALNLCHGFKSFTELVNSSIISIQWKGKMSADKAAQVYHYLHHHFDLQMTSK
ncbi:Fanconi anemia group M protein [Lingula anatina]|uniref:Fanconi anemia group M protein n=1 Tax=Lingula anatina TaxID=7574 RepID=A0A1S3H319_LINAN|nr:Fanconi anemia group M protein [Lingula anatina]|eukprot:XP_013379529.1 Fanconi anemia group M protein [Lingula anatina]